MHKLTVDKKNQEGFVDLLKSSLPQLKDLLERQNKLLNNARFINSLPDKGNRIKSFRDKITKEINSRNDVDKTARLLSEMNLQNLPNEIEWTGKKALENNEPLDSDDDDDEGLPNTLKLIANHSGTQKSYKIKQEPPEESLITSKDLEIISSSGLQYAQQICKKYDGKSAPDRFKLNQPKQKELAKSDFKSSSENVQKMLGKNWEVTSATPPVPVYGSTELVSLSDSLALQQEQAQRLKDIRLQEATAKLQNLSIKFGPLPSKNLMNYRTPTDPSNIFNETPISDKNESEEIDNE